ncbi:MAG: chorismate synthase [Thermodesulfobacteriota bacterium]
MLRYLTSGESHGSELTALIEGMPSGLRLSAGDIDIDLARRQGGYGRGARMSIEKDSVIITSGVRFAKTLGSPIGLTIKNKDWENWQGAMSVGSTNVKDKKSVTRPRPGHADLPGALKYDHSDVRNVLERSSARETAARVAAGAVAKRLLSEFGIMVYSFVTDIGGAGMKPLAGANFEKLFKAAEASEVRCPDKAASNKMIGRIKRAKSAGDSLGGSFQVVATGVPPGLGSYVQWDRKLNARLSMALSSIQAIKGVGVGAGFKVAGLKGSELHDEIFFKKAGKGKRQAPGFWPQASGFYRKTNNAGGIEGGTSNGEPIILSAAMKPIPTLYKPLRSVDIETHKAFTATIERSDVCAVPAAAVIGESVVAFELATSFLEKFGGDSLREISRNYRGYLKQIKDF